MKKVIIFILVSLGSQVALGALFCTWDRCCGEAGGLFNAFCQAGVGECVEFDCLVRPKVLTSAISGQTITTPVPVSPVQSGVVTQSTKDLVLKCDASLRTAVQALSTAQQSMAELVKVVTPVVTPVKP